MVAFQGSVAIDFFKNKATSQNRESSAVRTNHEASLFQPSVASIQRHPEQGNRMVELGAKALWELWQFEQLVTQ
jgi:hypothetical protein